VTPERLEDLMEDAPAPPEISPGVAHQVLKQARQERARQCAQAIQQALDAYRCTLDVGLLLRAGELPQPRMQIVALPDEA
jgi:hypothetical protein